MMTETIGYFALGLGLIAMSMKKILMLRAIHAFSAMAYLTYGYMIDARPVMAAGILFLGIHGYYIFQLTRPQKPTNS